jgi:hypothetical protein
MATNKRKGAKPGLNDALAAIDASSLNLTKDERYEAAKKMAQGRVHRDEQVGPMADVVQAHPQWIEIVTPFSRRRVARNHETGKWIDLTTNKEWIWADGSGYVDFALTRAAIKEETGVVNGVELPFGVGAVVGGASTGKTYFLNVLAVAIRASGRGCTVLGYNEPYEVGRLTYSTEAGIVGNALLLEHLCDFLTNGKIGDYLLLDSLSAFAFASWKDWGLLKFGINAGMMFWLTNLHNVALQMGKTIIITFNPGSGTDPGNVNQNTTTAMASLTDFLLGRVGAVMRLDGQNAGMYFYRSGHGATRGTRATMGVGELIHALEKGGPGGKSNMRPAIVWPSVTNMGGSLGARWQDQTADLLPDALLEQLAVKPPTITKLAGMKASEVKKHADDAVAAQPASAGLKTFRDTIHELIEKYGDFMFPI